jgi:hypothetical protein
MIPRIILITSESCNKVKKEEEEEEEEGEEQGRERL